MIEPLVCHGCYDKTINFHLLHKETKQHVMLPIKEKDIKSKSIIDMQLIYNILEIIGMDPDVHEYDIFKDIYSDFDKRILEDKDGNFYTVYAENDIAIMTECDDGRQVVIPKDTIGEDKEICEIQFIRP